MATHHPPAARKYVDLLNDKTDFKVALLGSLGFSTNMIAEKTGLSICQVTYRLSKAEVKRAAYRSGESAVARALLRHNTAIAEPVMMRQIRNTLRRRGELLA